MKYKRKSQRPIRHPYGGDVAVNMPVCESMKRMWRTISAVVRRKKIGWTDLIHGINIAEMDIGGFAKNHIL